MKFIISESEKNRILNMHKEATKKQYLVLEDEEPKYKPGDVYVKDDTFYQVTSGGSHSAKITQSQLYSFLNKAGVLGMFSSVGASKQTRSGLQSGVKRTINDYFHNPEKLIHDTEKAGIINPFDPQSVDIIKGGITSRERLTTLGQDNQIFEPLTPGRPQTLATIDRGGDERQQ